MQDLLAELNDDQKAAVLATEGPLLILAGAGSGKTKALTHRIAYLISQKNVPPDNILAVTFTNKAAGEMRQRVARLLGQTGHRDYMPYLGTFHSVCVRLLRREAGAIGYDQNFIIFDAADALTATKQAMRQLGINEKQFSPQGIHGLISSAKNELIWPEKYAGLAQGPFQDAAAKVYAAYQALLRQNNALDFDDLIGLTVRLFQTDSAILTRYQEQFRYILIDEYQDTNHAQYIFAKLLASAHRNICVVGDDWQSIYSWRGADFKNILDFERDYPEATIIKLEQNYRSTQNILAASHEVISKNTRRSDKKLWTAASDGQPVEVYDAYNESQEGEFIIRKIRDLLTAPAPNYHLRDFAVLYRTNAQSRSLEETFLRHQIPYKIVGGVRFYERREVKDALAYLRFIYQSHDFVSFSRIINLPPRGLGQKSLDRFLAAAQKPGLDRLNLVEAAANAGQIPDLSTKAAKSLQDFATLITRLHSEIATHKVSELIELVLKRSGYRDWLSDGSIQSEERIENLKELFSVAETYNDMGLQGFLEEVALISDLDNYSTATDAVSLMTVHAAKGLEFSTVFIAGLEEGIFPHSSSIFEPDQLEEERRLMYVAMTRAREHLFLLHATSRLLYGQTQHNPPSRFLADIPGQAAQKPSGFNPWDQTLDSLAEEVRQPAANFKPGDKVRHQKFGEGVVVSTEGDELVAAFAGLGVKKLSLSFAPIEKI